MLSEGGSIQPLSLSSIEDAKDESEDLAGESFEEDYLPRQGILEHSGNLPRISRTGTCAIISVRQ